MQVQQYPTEQADALDLMVNMGPQHPSTHGVFRVVIWVDGERIVRAEPHIGYLHRGSEKLCEGELYSQVITLFDRLRLRRQLELRTSHSSSPPRSSWASRYRSVPSTSASYYRSLTASASHMLFYRRIWSGCGRNDAGALRLPRARAYSRTVRERDRRAHDAQLLPHRRCKGRSARRLPHTHAPPGWSSSIGA